MIRFKDVSLKLGNKQLLEQFNLKIAKGDKVVISTPSGTGKSSLLKLLLGFFDADSGKIIFNQKEVKPENMRLIRRQIAYLSQDIDLPNGRIEDVFNEIFQYASNKSLPYSRELLLEKMKLVQLSEETLAKNTIDISGGECQRLGWVLIMLLDRPVWLLDEPTSALDTSMKEFFIDFVKKSKKTVICSSHDIEWHTEPMRIITNLRP